ncbi:MAG: glycosyltransferase family 2 protein [Nitrospirae bacterium]|nr:glycosyltransferase family 2 protein [Nitrospirota bacterium]
MNQNKVSIVIPAYNEASVIGDVVRKIKAVDPSYEVIVVDDGSQDGTSSIAQDAGARIIRHPYNIGNGASIKDGARCASGDVVVFIDGDGQHPPDEIPRLLEWIGEYDMVVGARTKKSRTSKFRNIGNSMLISVAQWITGRKIDDLTSGFRAIKREHLLEYLHLFPARYSYPTTITIAMFHGGHFVKYVPIDLITQRENGKSNIKPFRDFFKFIAIIFRIIMLFSPQRLFVPLGGLLFLLGVLVSGFQLWLTGGIQAAGTTLLLSSIYIACFGLLADQVVLLRRQKKE